MAPELTGTAWLLSRASYRPPTVTLKDVLERTSKVSAEVANRRDEFHLETPWPTLTRLIYDFLGIRFEEPMSELEMGFWRASVETRPMPGAREALREFHDCGVPVGVVSNCSFRQDVLRYELGKHGLADHLAFVMVSAEYTVRKPSVLLFETAASRLGLAAADIWFVGDSLEADIAGAKAAGMTAVRFAQSTADAGDLVRADLTAANWYKVSRLFREHRADLGGASQHAFRD